jgi:TM2 domain-containing membrane protein YozV
MSFSPQEPADFSGNPPADTVQSFAGKKIAAGVCGILLGELGVHKFILGLKTPGIVMLAVTVASYTFGACLIFPILGALAMHVIGIVEGVLYLTKSDEEFYRLYAVEKREWF